MKDLHQLVIPSVASKWKMLADYLEFKLPTIRNIEDQYRNNSVECCTELFRQWSSRDCGMRPRTWLTLINTLKEIKQLSTVAKEIEQGLRCK